MDPISRRHFLKTSLLTSGGLFVSLHFGPLLREAETAESAQSKEKVPLSPASDLSCLSFIRMNRSGQVVLTSKNPEIGQGIKTLLPMILAEELEVPWAQVQIEQASLDEARYGAQFCGGSNSVATNYDLMRRLGASCRLLLVRAASQRWGVPESECAAQAGEVHHRASGRVLQYAELFQEASKLPVPLLSEVKLKKSSEFYLLGKRIPDWDLESILKGKGIFGIDCLGDSGDQNNPRLEMQHAVFAKCPTFGGRFVSGNLEAVRKLPGVTQVFVLRGKGNPKALVDGVAVVARTWFLAKQALTHLEVQWDTRHLERTSSKDFVALSRKLHSEPPHLMLRKDRPSSESPKEGGALVQVQAEYSYPFLAHAPLEPQNCIAHFKRQGKGEKREGKNRLEIWAPSQTPQMGRALVAETLGMSESEIQVHLVRAGGGFGRRLSNDYMVEAAAIAEQVEGPVHLLFTREQDMTFDFYRPSGVHFLEGAVSGSGELHLWKDHFISFGKNGKFALAADIGVDEFPGRFIPDYSLSASLVSSEIPMGYLRAPGSNALCFVIQSFIDELAHASQQDPLEFRRRLLKQVPHPPLAPPGTSPYSVPVFDPARALGVLDRVAQRSNWKQRKGLKKGFALGVAFHYCHRGYFAHVAEVEVDAKKQVRVHRVWAVGDIGGPILRPSHAENLSQGAVIDGLSQLMDYQITIEEGRAVQRNFDSFKPIRISQAPREIDVHFVESEFPPTGLGEPALPPIIPAVCNALFEITGERVRSLPLSLHGYAWKKGGA